MPSARTPRLTARLRQLVLIFGVLLLTVPLSGCFLCHVFGNCKEDECTTTPTAPSCDTGVVTGSRELPIAPIAQQTQTWCWAASAEMILRYYNEPNLNPAGNYQCGVVGGYYYLIGGPSHPCVANCFLCPQGASSMFEIQRVITGYGQIALFYGIPARVLTSQSRFGQLTMKELAAELNAGRPVLAGVSPLGSLTLPGISAHAVVFSGYDATAGPMTVTIRDPYPYELFIPFNQNPWIQAGGTYLSPGSYRVAYSQLSGPYVTWGNTAYDIR